MIYSNCLIVHRDHPLRRDSDRGADDSECSTPHDIVKSRHSLRFVHTSPGHEKQNKSKVGS